MPFRPLYGPLLCLLALPALAGSAAQWQYGSDPRNPTAWLYSREVVNAYEASQGRSPNPIGLTIRQQGRRAPEVSLGQEKGSFYCPRHRCDVTLQFDDQPAEPWPAHAAPTPWAPRSYNHFTFKLDRSRELIQRLQHSHRMVMTVRSYPNITLTARFEAEPLQWPPQAPQ
ncbi:hypothetical protein [Leeia sp.]|uniref:hypothetical protein n=1 Tax=Leeia sp. TaxID=2884678 RepID=UPI0035B155D7